jgi:PST family polysaccharide transporter
MDVNRTTIRVFLSSKVVQNGGWLYILQIFNTVVPMITLPYITRVLGSSQYGVFSFSLNLVGYFQVMVDYGFNLSGARKIAIAKDKDEVSKIFSTITTCKILISLLTFIIMLIVSQILNVDKVQFGCLLILYSMVIGSALQQIWLFQGLQKMKYITIINVITRTISVVLIFAYVKDASQIYLYCFLYAMTFLLVGIISILVASKQMRIEYHKPSIKNIFNELKEGWYIFTTAAMTYMFSGFGVTILGITSVDSSVGVYSAIQKIPIIMLMMYAPIGQAIYPYISKLYLESFEKGIKSVKRISSIVIPFFIMISVVLIINRNYIVKLAFGHEYAVFSILLIPLTCWMLLSILNNFLGIQIVVASGHLKEYSIAFRFGLIALIVANIVLGMVGEIYGVAVAAWFAELILTLALVYQIKKIKHEILMGY